MRSAPYMVDENATAVKLNMSNYNKWVIHFSIHEIYFVDLLYNFTKTFFVSESMRQRKYKIMHSNEKYTQKF